MSCAKKRIRARGEKGRIYWGKEIEEGQKGHAHLFLLRSYTDVFVAGGRHEYPPSVRKMVQ